MEEWLKSFSPDHPAWHARQGLTPADLVIGFELPPNAVRQLDEQEVPLVGLTVCPIRFLDDVLFDFSCRRVAGAEGILGARRVPQAGSELTEALRSCVEGTVADTKQTLPPARMTPFIRDLARYYGALDVGVAELRSYHVYSHIGRGEGAYGAPILLEHKFAVALTVEMDYRMIAANPAAPGVVESIKQYVEAARVAI